MVQHLIGWWQQPADAKPGDDNAYAKPELHALDALGLAILTRMPPLARYALSALYSLNTLNPLFAHDALLSYSVVGVYISLTFLAYSFASRSVARFFIASTPISRAEP